MFMACKKENKDVKDNNTINGIVKFDFDEESYIAKGAKVTLHNGTALAALKTVTSDTVSGKYSFTAVPDGEYQISVIYVDTEHFAVPITFKARTASFKLAGEEVKTMDIICYEEK